MTFDKQWTAFEAKHGIQTPGAKQDAEFWFNAGVNTTPKDYISGQRHAYDMVKTFAGAEAPQDPFSKAGLLEFIGLMESAL